jgi:peptidoglycan/xylan/chitin deacetylase (PgdA/CDA1 family)
VLTFDDGFADLFDAAVPALRDAGVPAAFFVVTGALPGPGRMPGGDGPLLDGAGVHGLRDAGFEVGSHTRAHVRLPGASGEVAREEIAGSRADLEAVLGVAPDLFAYPWGAADPAAAAAVREAGYRAAFTTAGGAVRRGADLYLLPRIHVPGNASVSRVACEAAGLVPFLRGVR